jgi:hypothetical protein
MNISFTIPDELDADFIAAVRLIIPNRPDLSDARVIKKYLRSQIATMLDAYKQDLVVGALKTQLETTRQQSNTLMQDWHTAQQAYSSALRDYNATFIPTPTGPEE